MYSLPMQAKGGGGDKDRTGGSTKKIGKFSSAFEKADTQKCRLSLQSVKQLALGREIDRRDTGRKTVDRQKKILWVIADRSTYV